MGFDENAESLSARRSGQIFRTMQSMADAIERFAKTTTGFSTTAHVMEEQFRPASR
ncbi:hypothetical protein Poly24_36340 [Rosistilla carotiformis]|uniref:Uncharacterized protein n=1 Tax=Rosistilla carotiformis TaxID=2528017 RepID=A0A518JWK4_9BACT|nr:hypothetical protein Poly24_36340 [Rosistilla carotiformis]